MGKIFRKRKEGRMMANIYSAREEEKKEKEDKIIMKEEKIETLREIIRERNKVIKKLKTHDKMSDKIIKNYFKMKYQDWSINKILDDVFEYPNNDAELYKFYVDLNLIYEDGEFYLGTGEQFKIPIPRMVLGFLSSFLKRRLNELDKLIGK